MSQVSWAGLIFNGHGRRVMQLASLCRKHLPIGSVCFIRIVGDDSINDS